jgi:hypothetical protein
LFRGLRSFILLNYSSVEVVFAPRSCNKVAHEIAAIGALGEEARVLWVDSIHPDVNSVLASEFATPS